MTRPERFTDADACAEALIQRLAGRLRLALPLGLGKPVLLANALYRKARERPEVDLTIYTALTLEIPRARSPLEVRMLGPLVERLYAGVPELEYAADHRRGNLPPNVRLVEFYFRPGAALGLRAAQQNYVSSNYTHVARDLAARGVNVVAQMFAPGAGEGAGSRYSMSCNPDLTRDLMDEVTARTGAPPLIAGEANPALPWFDGSAEIGANEIDLLLESPDVDYPLFPVPNRPVGLTDHAIGLRVAALVRDGGTLQIGIGSLGDAVAHAVGLRHRDNARFRALIESLDAPAPHTAPFEQGLYASSEMFVEGFLYLRELGVLCRTAEDGAFLHGGFYLGSRRFYEALRRLPEAERRGIHMTRVSFTNRLLGDEEVKRRQRVHARFVNTTMMVTLLGAAASDALEDGRVVSGVGGQYDFVAMAHELKGGRSILVLPATRTAKAEVTSNIVWRYGHATIPRHLRDIVVTEYGVADLRGASDADVIAAMLNVADSRFQETLRKQAVAAGKLPEGYRIPERFRHNTPENLRRALTRSGELEALPWYPLGSDFTQAEGELAIALAALGEKQGSVRALAREVFEGRSLSERPEIQPALERLNLARPRGAKARAYRALVAAALVREVHDQARPLLPSASPPDEAESHPQASRQPS